MGKVDKRDAPPKGGAATRMSPLWRGVARAGTGVVVAALAVVATYRIDKAHEGVGANASARPSLILANGFEGASSANVPKWPDALQGTTAPRLSVDEHGRLLHVRDVRDFFDYFLTARSQLKSIQLDLLVRQQIELQLGGKLAAVEVQDLWQRYTSYLDALAKLDPPAPAMSISEMSNKGVANHHIETSAVRSILTRRAQLRSRWLGDWTVPFFGDEDAALSVYLKRIEIVQDATLDVDEKKRRIEALSSDLPPEQRRAEEEQKQQTQWLTSVDQLQKRNLSPEELRVAVTKIKGAEFAERFVAQQQADQAWDATYDRYASQRDQIRAQHLSPPDQERQLARLRAMFFSRQSDVLRAAGRDGSDTGKPW